MISLTDSAAINDIDQRLTLAIKEAIERTMNNDTTAEVLKVDVFSEPSIEGQPGRKPTIKFHYKISLHAQP